nr:hemerythrin family protein [Desulfobulbaceae bacterium]
MIPFVWLNSYSVNVKAIDDQHMGLINIINRLHAAMLENKSKLIMGDILQQLVEYSNDHFMYEENLLEAHDYPSLIDHKRVHEEMREKVCQLQSDYRSGKVIFSLTVMDFLKEWLADHILGDDHLYKDFLNSEGVY